MPEIDADGCRLHYVVDGPPDGPVLVLSNSIGTTHELWTSQVAPLSRSFRLVRYDTRGHGRSDAPPGPYTLDRLGRDVLALLDAVGARRAHFCGLSLGGITAMWLGLHAADRVGRLVMANTAAKVGAADMWEQRISVARSQGVGAFADAALTRWFSPAFTERRPDVVAQFRSMLAGCRAEGYIGCAAALRDADLTAEVAGIRAPTLVVNGSHDTATPPAGGEQLQRLIPGATLVTLDSAHLSNVEQPQSFADAVLGFLAA